MNLSPWKPQALHPEETLCFACINPPQVGVATPWWWHIVAAPDDFCARHSYLRFPEAWLQYSREEEQAALEAAALEPHDVGVSLEYFLPPRLMRCGYCGFEKVMQQPDLTAHEDLDCRVTSSWEIFDQPPYEPQQVNSWDTDDFALPRHEGMRRNSH